jgi:hypothetical protein
MIPFFDPGTPNNFYVFGIDATDLPAYQTRQLIPDPKARYSSPSDWHLLRSGCCAACASAFNRELQITGLPQINAALAWVLGAKSDLQIATVHQVLALRLDSDRIGR